MGGLSTFWWICGVVMIFEDQGFYVSEIKNKNKNTNELIFKAYNIYVTNTILVVLCNNVMWTI